MSTDQFERLLKEVNRAAAADIPRITEANFVKHFLPFLLDSDGETDLTPWLDVVGNPHRAFHVVDADQRILFTVPPLLTRLPTNADVHYGEQIHALLQQHAMLLRSAHPVEADHALMTGLQRENATIEETQLAQYVATWITIQSRYGVEFPRLKPLLDTIQPVAQSPDVVVEDTQDREFEDL